MTTQAKVNEFLDWLKDESKGVITLHFFTLQVQAQFGLQYGEAWQMVQQWAGETVEAKR